MSRCGQASISCDSSIHPRLCILLSAETARVWIERDGQDIQPADVGVGLHQVCCSRYMSASWRFRLHSWVKPCSSAELKTWTSIALVSSAIWSTHSCRTLFQHIHSQLIADSVTVAPCSLYKFCQVELIDLIVASKHQFKGLWGQYVGDIRGTCALRVFTHKFCYTVNFNDCSDTQNFWPWDLRLK